MTNYVPRKLYKSYIQPELKKLWEDSGHSLKSLHRWLENNQTKGLEQSYDESCGMAYFDDCKVFFSPYGYKVIGD